MERMAEVEVGGAMGREMGHVAKWVWRKRRKEDEVGVVLGGE